MSEKFPGGVGGGGWWCDHLAGSLESMSFISEYQANLLHSTHTWGRSHNPILQPHSCYPCVSVTQYSRWVAFQNTAVRVLILHFFILMYWPTEITRLLFFWKVSDENSISIYTFNHSILACPWTFRLIKSDEIWNFIHMNIFELHNMTKFTIPLKYFIIFLQLSHRCLNQHKVKSGMACWHKIKCGIVGWYGIIEAILTSTTDISQD